MSSIRRKAEHKSPHSNYRKRLGCILHTALSALRPGILKICWQHLFCPCAAPIRKSLVEQVYHADLLGIYANHNTLGDPSSFSKILIKVTFKDEPHVSPMETLKSNRDRGKHSSRYSSRLESNSPSSSNLRNSNSPEFVRNKSPERTKKFNSIWECEICLNTYPERRDLDHHFAVSHRSDYHNKCGKRKIFSCRVCLDGFTTYQELYSHLEEKGHRCPPHVAKEIYGQRGETGLEGWIDYQGKRVNSKRRAVHQEESREITSSTSGPNRLSKTRTRFSSPPSSTSDQNKVEEPQRRFSSPPTQVTQGTPQISSTTDELMSMATIPLEQHRDPRRLTDPRRPSYQKVSSVQTLNNNPSPSSLLERGLSSVPAIQWRLIPVDLSPVKHPATIPLIRPSSPPDDLIDHLAEILKENTGASFLPNVRRRNLEQAMQMSHHIADSTRSPTGESSPSTRSSTPVMDERDRPNRPKDIDLRNLYPVHPVPITPLKDPSPTPVVTIDQKDNQELSPNTQEKMYDTPLVSRLRAKSRIPPSPMSPPHQILSESSVPSIPSVSSHSCPGSQCSVRGPTADSPENPKNLCLESPSVFNVVTVDSTPCSPVLGDSPVMLKSVRNEPSSVSIITVDSSPSSPVPGPACNDPSVGVITLDSSPSSPILVESRAVDDVEIEMCQIFGEDFQSPQGSPMSISEPPSPISCVTVQGIAENCSNCASLFSNLTVDLKSGNITVDCDHCSLTTTMVGVYNPER